MPDDPCVDACQDALDAALLAVSQVENLLATTGLLGLYDPDYVSYTVGTKPGSAPDGTVGAYYPVSGVFQLLLRQSGAWVDVGPPTVLKENGVVYARLYPSLGAAVAAVSTGGTVRVDVDVAVADATSVPPNVVLEFVGLGRLTVSANKTLTVNGGVIAERTHVFAGPGTVRLPGPDEVYPEWFGARRYATRDEAFAGRVDSRPAFTQACLAVSHANPGGPNGPDTELTGAHVAMGRGAYFFGSTLVVRRSIVLRGQGGHGFRSETVICTGGDYPGIVVAHDGTGSDVQVVPPGGATFSFLSDFTVWGERPETGGRTPEQARFQGAAHGIRIETTGVKLARVSAVNCDGCGIAVIAGYKNEQLYPGPEGEYTNANLCSIVDGRVAYNAGDGLYFSGDDTNACVVIEVDATENAGWGFRDESLLGNAFYACHTAGNDEGAYWGSAIGMGTKFLDCYVEVGQGPADLVAGGSIHIMAPGSWKGGNHGGTDSETRNIFTPASTGYRERWEQHAVEVSGRVMHFGKQPDNGGRVFTDTKIHTDKIQFIQVEGFPGTAFGPVITSNTNPEAWLYGIEGLPAAYEVTTSEVDGGLPAGVMVVPGVIRRGSSSVLRLRFTTTVAAGIPGATYPNPLPGPNGTTLPPVAFQPGDRVEVVDSDGLTSPLEYIYGGSGVWNEVGPVRRLQFYTDYTIVTAGVGQTANLLPTPLQVYTDGQAPLVIHLNLTGSAGAGAKMFVELVVDGSVVDAVEVTGSVPALHFHTVFVPPAGVHSVSARIRSVLGTAGSFVDRRTLSATAG